MDIEHKLRTMDQARLTTDGIHFNSIEGQAWLNRVVQVRLDEMEVELFDTGVLKKGETANEPAISTFVLPNLEMSLGTVPAVTTYKPQSSSEPGLLPCCKQRVEEQKCWRTASNSVRIANDVLQDTETESAESVSQEEEMEH